jgi:hypothetical protein
MALPKPKMGLGRALHFIFVIKVKTARYQPLT